MAKSQRIRDPVHDLIEFSADPFEQVLWRVLNTSEFQRLRRIKQLGFSELVFPGATHSRFAHSVGVFNTARELSAVIERRLSTKFDSERAKVATCAALVHDVGHGPFSHAFEDAMASLKAKKRHEDWTAEVISGDTELGNVLRDFDSSFRSQVAELLASETPSDIYASIVSSQFDADRLDYVRRDRLMTGAQHGGFDYSWLLANLEVDTIPLAVDDETYRRVEGLILGNKAFEAAEAYVLGLFHLYFTVYFHKTTRAAEAMLAAILRQIGQLVHAEQDAEVGLESGHPMLVFLKENSLESYLSLDDSVIWASLHSIRFAKNEILRELADRLLRRELYKAVDVSAFWGGTGSEAAVVQFRSDLWDAKQEGRFGPIDVFEDKPTRDPYKRRGYDIGALSKVLIRRVDGTGYVDLSERSEVVAALEKKSVFRVYVRNQKVRNDVCELAERVGA